MGLSWRNPKIKTLHTKRLFTIIYTRYKYIKIQSTSSEFSVVQGIIKCKLWYTKTVEVDINFSVQVAHQTNTK